MIRVTASTGNPRGWTVYEHPAAQYWHVDTSDNLVLTGENGRVVATYADGHWSRVATDDTSPTPREPEGHHDPEYWRDGPHEPA